MKSLSSVIKGQRIRSESILPIQLTSSIKTSLTCESTDKQKTKKDHENMVAQVKKAEQKAREIIQEAEERAKEIIQLAEQKASQESKVVLEKAKEDGYTQGHQKGYEEGALEAQSLINESKQVLQDAHREKKKLLKEAEPEAIEMVIKVCQKILSEEVGFNPNIIRILIRKSLGELQYDTQELIVKVPTQHYDYVIENKEHIFEGYAISSGVEILKDSTLDEGTYIIETPFGSVECNVTTQFEELKKQIRLIASNE